MLLISVTQNHMKLIQEIKMKYDKIFFTVYACPDDWGMAQAMSSVFSTYLSICSQNNFPALLNVLGA